MGILLVGADARHEDAMAGPLSARSADVLMNAGGPRFVMPLLRALAGVGIDPGLSGDSRHAADALFSEPGTFVHHVVGDAWSMAEFGPARAGASTPRHRNGERTR